MVVAETLAGIALLQSAVKAIKGGLDSAKDISSIAGSIDDLFAGHQQVNKTRNQIQKDPFSLKSITSATIDAKIAEEQLYEMSLAIDMRFGFGTWTGIVNERARLMQEQKAILKARAKEKAREKAALVEDLKTVGWALLALVVIGCTIASLVIWPRY
jgi:hypothetical protein